MNERTNKLINSIREVKIDGKMALVSLYDDLPHFEYDLTINNLENSIKKLKNLVQELKQQIKKLENENSYFKSLNSILSKNISSLYKTAKNEIQRKDKIIEEIRKSNTYAPVTSKMFSYSNILPLEKTQNNQFSKEHKDTEHVINVAEKSNILNENNKDNSTNILIQPNYDIPKTVYYTRLCKKLFQQNQVSVPKNEMPIDIQSSNTISTGEITQDKNEKLNNDKNVLKEMITPYIHHDSENNPKSTLIVCESDLTSNDCMHNATPINQFENSEKEKENVSTESFFTSLKQSIKMKKKMVIAPATIGVPNMLNENLSRSEKNQSLNKDIKSTCNNEHTNKDKSKIDNKQLIRNNTFHNNKPSTSINCNQLSKTIDVEHVPVGKEIIEEKDSNSLMHKKVIKSPCATGLIPLSDNQFIISSNNVKSKDKLLLINNEKESCCSSKLENNQLDSELPINKHVSNFSKLILLNDSVKSSSKHTSVETSNSTINIEVDQIPVRRKTIADEKYTEENNNTKSNNIRTSSYETCTSPSVNKEFNTSTRVIKSLSPINEIKSSISSKQKNSQLESKSSTINNVNDSTGSIQLNDSIEHSPKNKSSRKSIPDQTSLPSTNIEVEQVPFRRKTTVKGRDNNNKILNNVKKSFHETCTSPSVNNKCNTSTRIVKCLSPSNEIKSPISSKQRNSKLESKSSIINNINNSTESIQLNDSVEHSPKNKSSRKSLPDQTSIPSTNIEVEQVPFRRKTIFLGRDTNNAKLNDLRKSSHETCTVPSVNNKFNTSTRIVKCLSPSNEIKSPISSKQRNSQLESKSPTINRVNNSTEYIQLNDSVEHSPKNKSSRKSIPDQTSLPSTNIEVEQVPFRRKTTVTGRKNNNKKPNDVKKSSHEICTSPSVNNKCNTSTRIVKCLSPSNEIKSPILSKQRNSQLESKSPTINNVNNSTESIQLNDSIECYSTEISTKISIPSINIEVEQGSIFRRSGARKVIKLSKSDDNKQEIKKGRRVQLITIQDHFSQPLPSFYGAKKTDIDVSKNSIHIEKVVESSSLFYVPQVKRRRTMNFGNSDS